MVKGTDLSILFLSTLSLRRATRTKTGPVPPGPYFYPRSPCGERQPRQTRHCKKLRFLSTLSLRRATVHYDNYNLHCVISIHALLAESDPQINMMGAPVDNFYPRSPCGERPPVGLDLVGQMEFLSTLSLRRATFKIGKNLTDRKHFYPRSPCGERHEQKCCNRKTNVNFYPRSPCGERPAEQTAREQADNFYPRSPCGERPGGKIHNPGEILFLSTLSLRRATSEGTMATSAETFLSTLSLRRATPRAWPV